jgi:hypothetical protein
MRIAANKANPAVPKTTAAPLTGSPVKHGIMIQLFRELRYADFPKQHFVKKSGTMPQHYEKNKPKCPLPLWQQPKV